MLKSILIYGGILAVTFILRFVLVALVDHLEAKLKERKNPSPFWLPLLLAFLTFIAGVLIVAQISTPILWILSRWDIVYGVVLMFAILAAAAVGTYMSFAALQDMRKYGTKKKLHYVTAIIFFLYMDWILDLAAVSLVTAFDFSDLIRAVLNVSFFTVYTVYLIVLLVKSLKST